jgi:hypothetical protein
VVAFVILICWLPDSHLPRIVATLLPLGLGLIVAVAVARRCRWFVGLAWFGAAVGLAVLAWCFVPTTSGRNLWSARQEASRLVAELEALPACDRQGYAASKGARQALINDFPEFKSDVEQAEDGWANRSAALWESDLGRLEPKDAAGVEALRQAYHPLFGDRFPTLKPRLEKAENAWLNRSIAAWENDLEQLKPQDYAGLEALRQAYKPFFRDRVQQLEAAELAWLGRSYSSLPPGNVDAVRRARACWSSRDGGKEEIHGWESAWADRTAAAVVKDVGPGLKKDPDAASTRLRAAADELRDLGEYPAAQEKVLAARRQAVQARLELARIQLRELVAADRYQAAAADADKLATGWEAEARAVGLTDELTRLRQGYAFLADLARQAGKPDPK